MEFKRFLLLCCACGALVGYVSAQTNLGRCDFIPGVSTNAPTLDGYVTFVDNNNGTVTVSVNVTGIPSNSASSVGIHVHAFGDITDPAGNSAGGHFNPLGQNHSCPGTTARHLGDMGNWNVTAGSIVTSQTFDLLTLTGANSIIGHAVVIHNGTDDCTTQPTGASGNRNGFCVIGIQNNAANGAGNGQTAGTTTSAVASLWGTTDAGGCGGYNNCRGTAYFTLTSGVVNVVVSVPTGLSTTGGAGPGKYGLHIHQFGDLSDRANATNAGGHWNPTSVVHGFPSDTVHHTGDLGNIQNFNSATSNTFWYNFTATYITSIESILGRAVIIHTDADHGQGSGCSNATGSSGNRRMIGVIGIANSTAFGGLVPSVPIAVTNTWSPISCLTTTTAGTTIGSTTRSSSAMALGCSLVGLFAALLASFLW